MKQQFQIEKNVAKLEEIVDNYRVVVTVEHQQADDITTHQATFALTKALPLILTQYTRARTW